jgi:hypothetical protein
VSTDRPPAPWAEPGIRAPQTLESFPMQLAAAALPRANAFPRQVWLALATTSAALLLMLTIGLPGWSIGLLMLLGGYPVSRWLGSELKGNAVVVVYLLVGLLTATTVLSPWIPFALITGLVTLWWWADRM